MNLARGTRLGPYEIVSLLGVGGMGEVYRARDTRLDRTVAVKVLPAALSGNEELRARFEREARAISALSHPNICALYDIGSDAGTEYLVMEYLEGETLAERLTRGPLPATQLIRLGTQIAEALHQAHRAGITHRDLKPGNIMLTASGAKLLDFGLAKLIEPAPRVFSERSAPATHMNPLTTEGTVVGTTFYMSPEQLQGKPLDRRTDIFSLGVVLYEMATGQRPFQSDSVAGLIASILTNDPPAIRELQPNVSPALERVITTALEKDPDQRWQTAHDLGRQLRWMGESSSLTSGVTTTSSRWRPGVAAAVAVTALVAGLVAFSAARIFMAVPEARELRMQISYAPYVEPAASSELNQFAISPDGRSVACIAFTGGVRAIFLRPLDSFAFRKIEGTDGAAGPFWSSDGNWIGYSAAGKLWKTRVAGGTPPEALCEINRGGARGTWAGNKIIFAEARGTRTGLLSVPESGGTPVAVTTVSKSEWRHAWPAFLPDGKHFVYLSFSGNSPDRALLLGSLDDSRTTVLLKNISLARPASRDRLVFVRDGELLSQSFDFDSGKPTGDPETLASRVTYFYPTARADFDASPAGTVAYRTETSTGRLVVMDRSGRVNRIIDDKNTFWDHAISPDGRKAAVTVLAPGTGLMDIWIYDLVRGVRDRFTMEPATEVSPAWAPDARTIIYSQAEGGTFPHLVRRSLAGSPAEELTPRGTFQFSANVAPDGESVLYEDGSDRGSHIMRYWMKTKKTERVLNTSFGELGPAVSPDGRWLAYGLTATGAPEIYIQSLGVADADRIRISSKGGSEARWRKDSMELLFVASNGWVTSAVPGPGGRWEDATTTELFKTPSNMQFFDAAPDGQSFLVSETTPGPADNLLHVIVGAP